MKLSLDSSSRSFQNNIKESDIMLEENSQDREIEIKEDDDLNSTSESSFNLKKDLQRTLDDNILEKVIKETSISVNNSKELKRELRRIVMNEILFFSSKKNLINKIQHDEITNKEDLIIEINKEKTEKGIFIDPLKKTEEIKEENIKNILREIVSNVELDSSSRLDLFYKIKNNEIITEDRLEKEIMKKRKEEDERKNEELKRKIDEQNRRIYRKNSTTVSRNFSSDSDDRIDEGYGRQYWHDLYG